MLYGLGMEDGLTTVSVGNLPVDKLELLRSDAVRAGMTNTYAGVLRYTLMLAAEAKAASAASDGPDASDCPPRGKGRQTA